MVSLRRKQPELKFKDRLGGVIRTKELAPKDIHERTGLPYDQLARIGDGPRGPSARTLQALAKGLEIDANYLLETDQRYEAMALIQTVARMALDRYLMDREILRDPVSETDIHELRYVAEHSSKPPLWSSEWATHHERTETANKARAGQPKPQPQPDRRRIQRPRPLRS